jgi:hypothetical protein
MPNKKLASNLRNYVRFEVLMAVNCKDYFWGYYTTGCGISQLTAAHFVGGHILGN